MADDETEKASGSAGKVSMTMWLAAMAVLTLVAGGVGAGFGLYMISQTAKAPGTEDKPAAAAPGAEHIENANVRDLPPIITNLDQTSDTWVRLHVAIVFDPKAVEKPDIMAAEIASDIQGFMQTLSIAQLSGSSGLQHLREDLNDRAIVRSDGRVHELVIESLVVQ
jgi:flagellar FliL protein